MRQSPTLAARDGDGGGSDVVVQQVALRPQREQLRAQRLSRGNGQHGVLISRIRRGR